MYKIQTTINSTGSQSKAESDAEFKNGAGDQALPGEQDEGTRRGNHILI
jgi:hypothetical protein